MIVWQAGQCHGIPLTPLSATFEFDRSRTAVLRDAVPGVLDRGATRARRQRASEVSETPSRATRAQLAADAVSYLPLWGRGKLYERPTYCASPAAHGCSYGSCLTCARNGFLPTIATSPHNKWTNAASGSWQIRSPSRRAFRRG